MNFGTGNQSSRLRPAAARPLIALAAMGVALGCGCGGGRTAAGPRVEVNRQDASIDGLAARKFTTEHFTIYSTVADTGLEEILPVFLESAFRRYESSFASPPAEPVHLTTYVFGTRPEWLRYVGRHHAARYDVYSRIRAGGFTEGTTAYLFYSQRSETLATLAHEGWHQYLGARVRRGAPAWLNEGLACYHEAFHYGARGPEFTPEHNTFRIEGLRRALQVGELLPLPQIVATDAGEVISRNHSVVTQVYYAQAWALVTFLRHGDGGRHRRAFDRLMSDLADGSFAAKASAARLTAGGAGRSYGAAIFEFYFGSPPEALADRYYDHVVKVSGF